MKNDYKERRKRNHPLNTVRFVGLAFSTRKKQAAKMAGAISNKRKTTPENTERATASL